MAAESSSRKMIVPLGFSKVQEGVYRSAYPASKSFPFIRTLGLKSMVCLCPGDVRSELETFCAEQSITLLKYDVKFNQDPFLCMCEDTINAILDHVQNDANQPVLLFSFNGRVSTACVVGCLRKRTRWCMSSIILEFEQFSEPDGSLCDLQFIDSFESKPS
ncbi:protein-tyrosine phosphatase [Ochromonadaceae sp. CCMP2298]|nr:protein-tyrosine phosphatase [Ochromonadaceae sp. CCMP2298]|mmetsp:Transcript_8133/g.17792  ORF Transcript_8133/g.17792 Transcript_8133/m.17792 type:complete len:161 (-) Transcript_8133:49-531(-)